MKEMDDIKKLIEDSGMSQSELARRLNISRSSVNAWVKGIQSPTLKRYQEILKVLGVNTDSLAISNTVSKAFPVRYAPVLDYVQAGNFTSLSNIDTSELEQIILPPNVDFDPEKDFIVKVNGDSMLDKSHKKCLYPDEYLVVDSKKQYNIGDVVVAYIEGSNEATVKLLTGEVGNMYLEPLNQRYIGRDGFVVPKDCQVTIKGIVKAVIPPARQFIS